MELALRTWGDGPGRLLLVHGLSSSADGWWRLAPRLAELGFTVTAPDLRGHGRSGQPGDYRISSYAADLVELGTGWDVAVGHSLGGSAVIAAADQDPSFAGRLLLMDPGIWIAPDPEAEADLTASFRQPLTKEAVMEANPSWHPEDARIKAEALALTSVEICAETFRQNIPWNVAPELMRITVPTLVLGADPNREALVPRSLGESLAALSEHIEFDWVRHGSHSMHRDEFDATWDLIEGWLNA